MGVTQPRASGGRDALHLMVNAARSGLWRESGPKSQARRGEGRELEMKQKRHVKVGNGTALFKSRQTSRPTEPLSAVYMHCVCTELRKSLC